MKAPVLHVRAEDSSGAFGIEPRPCGFSDHLLDLRRQMAQPRITSSTTSRCEVACCECATASCVEVATREAVVNDDLATPAPAKFSSAMAEEP